jgi:phosphoglucosamine mutase
MLRFGTDGVRGLANVELTPELALALGRAAARVLGAERPFVLARDTRRSGPMLEAALAAGLAAEGADVVLAGVLPTPGAAYLSHVRDCPAAVLSASHNPFPDNGIKFFVRGGRKLSDQIEERLEAELDAILSGEPPPRRVEGAAVGTAQPDDSALRGYESWLLTTLEGRRLDGLRVVIDCGNGAATATAPWVLTQLGAKIENLPIGAQPDGTNINAGCGSTDTGPLQAEVVATGAAAGLAFDGDADRLEAALTAALGKV